ncbi:MAG TPA: ferrous iron transport protein B [Tissierellia bacterium]|nr:ferrous iron transport protein B [Tissierellia bacterium]
MKIHIALAGNPNSGKTTLFNSLTGSAQYVGNWPGVTVEKKEGMLKGHRDVIIQDLPGIYSLSPYTQEEIVARNYLVDDRPDAIINIVDGTNLERNLYLTTQLLELGIPMLIAINMMDLVRKRGDVIDIQKLSESLGCPVFELSALKSEGSFFIAEKAILLARSKAVPTPAPLLSGPLEESIDKIKNIITDCTEERLLPWTAIKLFEGDEVLLTCSSFADEVLDEAERIAEKTEKLLDDDAQSLITAARYTYITELVNHAVDRALPLHAMTFSDRIDSIVTHRIFALPIFAVVMFLVYFVSVTTVGHFVTEFTNETLFGEWIVPSVKNSLAAYDVAPWLISLISQGIIGGVGSVLGFVPQMFVLFLMLSLLEEGGYMARIAFILDRIFRRFGLSGKSFIPMLIGSGCSVPGIMASRTIEQESDRRMTIMTTSFIPCGAKMPIIALIAGALFGGAWWVAPLAYFVGVTAVIISGIILKKFRAFGGIPSPFVLELPPYHWPSPKNIWLATWERGFSFVKRAGTVILLTSIILWFLQAFGFEDGAIHLVDHNADSLLASIGRVAAPFFAPLGFGTWQATVGTFSGLIAKENVVGTLGVLYNFSEVTEGGTQHWNQFANEFSALSALSFLIFNLLCAPCFAAMGTIRKEMNSGRWTFFALLYMTAFAYVVSLNIYQIGSLIKGEGFNVWTFVAFFTLAVLLYLLIRKPPADLQKVRKRSHA